MQYNFSNLTIPDQSFTIEDQIKLYCETLDKNLIWILVVVGIMWLLESKLTRLIQEKTNLELPFVKMMYKLTGLGTLFIGGLIIFLR